MRCLGQIHGFWRHASVFPAAGAVLGQTVIQFPVPDAKTPADALARAEKFIAEFRGEGTFAGWVKKIAARLYLRRLQNPDGGFGQSEGRSSNAQSTAYAVQGLVAFGRDPSKFRRGGRSPLRRARPTTSSRN